MFCYFKRVFSITLMTLLLFLFSRADPTQAGVNTWTTNGPYGGVTSLAIDPVTSTTLYATASGGVYKSVDGGTTWSFSNNGLSETSTIAIDPNNPTTLYVVSGWGAVSKSSDSGINWSAISSGLPSQPILDLAIDSNLSSNMYAATFGNGVYKSIDGGSNWSPANSGLTIIYTRVLAIDPITPTTLYVGGNGGVFKSTDGGANWVEMNNGLPVVVGSTTCLDTETLAIDPITPTTIYAGNCGKVFKSTDGGANWLPSLDNSLTGGSVLSLVINPTTPTTIYVGTYGEGVLKSTDGGSNWSSTTTGLLALSYPDVLAVNPNTTSTVYAGSIGGVFKSTNSGTSWNSANTGITSQNVNVVAINPSTSNIIYAGTNNAGIFKSTDSGVSWDTINNGLESPWVKELVVDPVTPTTLYAGLTGGIYKSIDSGATWNLSNTGITDSNIEALAINPTTTTILYTGTLGGVFKSVDGGANWSPTNNGLTNLNISALAINPATPTILYAATAVGVFKSTDSGANWFATNIGLSNLDVDALVIDPITPSNLYAGTYGSGVFKSTDSAANWFPINSGLSITHVNNLAINPVSPTILYVGGRFGQGISESKDGGQSWAAMNSGLSDLSIGGLVIDPINPINLYTGTASGVFGFQRYTDPYEPDNTSGQANWIISSVSQTHSIIPANDVDWVKFSLTAESEVVLETSGVSSDTRMWLYDSILNQVDFDDDGGTNLFSKIDRLCGVDALAAGTYYVKIDEFGNNNEIASYNISLTTTACPTPILQVSPTNLDFNAIEGGSNPSSQSFNISNGGTGTLNWTASESLSWLSLDSTSGTAPATVNASVDISGLTAGTYNGQITISSSDAQNSPQTVNVTLNVEGPYQVNGKVVNGLDIGIDGVLVSIGGKTAITDNDGNYTVVELGNGVYNPSFSKTNYSFSGYPTSITIQNGNQSANAVGHYTAPSVDSGFRPNPNGFSFNNFGYSYEDNDATWSLFKRAFPSTLMENSDGSRKQAAYDFFKNHFLTAAGHCRGFSHASLIHYAGLKTLETTEDDGLSPPNSNASYIYDVIWRDDSKDYLHIYQNRWYTALAARAFHNGKPTEILQLVKDALADFEDNALDIAIYILVEPGKMVGHSVVPYKVERVGNIDRIYVYDNNSPNNDQKYIEINTTTDSWTYNIGGQTYWNGSESWSIYVDLARNNFPGVLSLSQVGSNMILPTDINTTASNVMVEGDVSPTFIDNSGNKVSFVGNQLINEIPGASVQVLPMFNPDDPDAVSPIIYQLPLTATYTLQISSTSSGAYTVTTYASGMANVLSGLEDVQGFTDEITLEAGLREISLQAAGASKDYCFLFADDELNDASRSFEVCTTTNVGGHATFEVSNDNNQFVYSNNGQPTTYTFIVKQTGQQAGDQTITGQVSENGMLTFKGVSGSGPGGYDWMVEESGNNKVYLPIIIK